MYDRNNAGNNGQAEQPKAQTAEQSAGRMSGWSFHDRSQSFSAIPANIGSEFYTKFKLALEEKYKNTDDALAVRVLDLNKAEHTNLHFSALLVCTALKAAPTKGVAYFVLLLEATGDEVPKAVMNFQQMHLERSRVSADAIDGQLLRLAEEKVAKAYGANTPIYNVSGMVVPRTVNVEDQKVLHRIAAAAGVAGATELFTREKDYRPLNLKTLRNDGHLSIDMLLATDVVDDAVGRPMRSDALINFISTKNRSNDPLVNNSINTGDRDVVISSVSAFVELLWAPMASASNPYIPQNQQLTQKFAARAVITNLESAFNTTPGAILLGLSSALVMAQNANWLQLFVPRTTGASEIDLRDIGAINIKGNLGNDPSGNGPRIKTKSAEFSDVDLGNLATALIQPGLLFAVDCPDYGPQSYYMDLFKQASMGNTDAIHLIYQEANELSGGEFANLFSPTDPMFIDTNNRVHLGRWRDHQGRTRDIRDIDLLAVSNLVGDRSPDVIFDWSDTFLNQAKPLEMRLEAREKMLRALTGDSLELDGTAHRVTFSSKLIGALTQCIRSSNMQVRVTTPMDNKDFMRQHATATFVQAGLVSSAQPFAQPAYGFGYNQMYQQQFYR